MKPAISIIVPVYNVEAYLRKCLDSILSQTFTDFEVILVNDGSTDESGEICNDYAEKDKRVKAIHQKNGGVSSARNAGVRLATGKYIGFVDGDDYVTEDMYKTLYQKCKQTGSDISISKLGREVNSELINDDNSNYYVNELTNEEAMRELFKGNLYRFSLCNKLFKKTCFENVYFPEGRIHEDLATIYKLFANSKKSVFTNHLGYIYIKRKNSILTSKYYEERLEAFTGWNEIIHYMYERYPQLESEFIASFTYGCLDNMYYIVNQVAERKTVLQYLDVIRKYIKGHYRSIIRNKKIAMKNKYHITMISLNTRIFMLSNRLKKFILRRSNRHVKSSNI